MTTDQAVLEALDGILAREGGYVDHPADGGGPTKFGITAATLGAWRQLGRTATPAEVEQLHESEARAIYRHEYIVRPGLDAIENPVLFAAVLDIAVNHGPTRAVRFLQHALGVKVDGTIGRFTRAALAAEDLRLVYRKVVAERAREYGRIISSDHKQAVFAAGWMNRLASFIELSA